MESGTKVVSAKRSLRSWFFFCEATRRTASVKVGTWRDKVPALPGFLSTETGDTMRHHGSVNTHISPGWWFGTMEFYDFPIYWECHHPNWRTHIFQRDWNHQPVTGLWNLAAQSRLKLKANWQQEQDWSCLNTRGLIGAVSNTVLSIHIFKTCLPIVLGGKQKWVCLKIGYIPNYSHLIGIMISKTIGFRGLAYFQTHPYELPHINSSHHLGNQPGHQPATMGRVLLRAPQFLRFGRCVRLGSWKYADCIGKTGFWGLTWGCEEFRGVSMVFSWCGVETQVPALHYHHILVWDPEVSSRLRDLCEDIFFSVTKYRLYPPNIEK